MLFAAFCLGTLALIGCGPPQADYDSVGLATVSGTITMDDKPLEGAVVRFYEAGGRGRYSYGETNADGYYELQFNSEAAGVLQGQKDVVISTAMTGAEVKRNAGPEQVPTRYNRETELTRTVEENGTHTFDFALTSDGEIAKTPRGGGEGDEGDEEGI
ncbi:carboxypeptidase regulatory-like domain-containing protein [Alienimonas chondri]|uniref:carboxypeptidase regulatory-like domain-containing protein n=1 Tax=Alienimonas chondri TaxID=2681879 RepID=UPI001583E98D|nr:carboxypeptidase regulatory-like domain-containing protein [Alienimonas chondri]